MLYDLSMRISRKKLLMVLVLWFCAWAQPRAAIFGFDERVPYSEAGNRERLGLLYATGSVSCLDGALGSGFIVDVSDYMEGDAPLTIIATTARVLYDARTGKARNTCAFRPASAPGQYLKIDARLAGTPRPGHLDPNDWAFAKLSKPFGSLGFGRMKLDSRFVLSDADRPRVWAAGYAIKWGSVAFAGKCRAESGLSYLSLWRRKDALASMVIHDCDTMKGARGG
ncbi:MAG: hypothetical protein R3174_15435, partial [Gammaproteobacteria bacterium]|nr:hypothetical protein [Gammaproteobacteria bacterium]